MAQFDLSPGPLFERWLPVPAFPNYEVSDQGRVSSLRRRGARGGLIATYENRKQYLRIGLWREGRKHWIFLHRLVLLTFVGPPPEGHEAGHKKPDRHDCRLENLEWQPISANRADANFRRFGKGLDWMDVLAICSQEDQNDEARLLLPPALAGDDELSVEAG